MWKQPAQYQLAKHAGQPTPPHAGQPTAHTGQPTPPHEPVSSKLSDRWELGGGGSGRVRLGQHTPPSAGAKELTGKTRWGES